MTDWKFIEDKYEANTYDRYPVVFDRGEGIYLYDIEGNKYTDLYGGHCVSILGHSPHKVTDAIFMQAKQLPFYSNVIYHPSRARASQKLIEISPKGFDRVFFCNSGTEANENAIKIAWIASGKTHVISTIGGWHGRTLASASVTWSEKIRKPVKFALPDVTFIPFGDATALEKLLQSREDIAGFILEPIQSINGIITASKEYFQEIREICTQYGVILIFDEIQTGIGRTGKFSYSEWLGVKPDLITLAKSLASGYPAGAVLMPEEIASLLKKGDLGSTFAGGMMAMAAVESTLQVIESEGLMVNAERIFKAISSEVDADKIKISGAGCLIGLRLKKPAKEITQELFKLGWITGSSDDPYVIRLMPPLITPIEIIIKFAQELNEIV